MYLLLISAELKPRSGFRHDILFVACYLYIASNTVWCTYRAEIH